MMCSGRSNTTHISWQMVKPSVCSSWCYQNIIEYVVDVKPFVAKMLIWLCLLVWAIIVDRVFYSSSCSGVLTRTSFHVCGRWYLSMFLFRDGSLTLIKMTTSIDLIRFCPSLPTMLKFLTVVLWPVMYWWSYIGEGTFSSSLNLSPNVLPDSPNLSTSQSTSLHISVNHSTFLKDGVLVLWGDWQVPDSPSSI